MQNAGATKIPFYKLINGDLGLNASDDFTFSANANALTVPGLTSSVGIKLSNPVSGSLAGSGSFLGINTDGNLVITSSLGGISYGRRTITTTATASSEDVLIGISASSPIDLRLASAADYDNGQYFTIKDEAGNANIHNITVKTSGSETIDGQSSVVLESPFVSINVYSNGTDKFFIY